MNGHHPSFGGGAPDSCRRTTVTRPGARLGFWSSSRVPSGLSVPPITTSLGRMVVLLSGLIPFYPNSRLLSSGFLGTRLAPVRNSIITGRTRPPSDDSTEDRGGCQAGQGRERGVADDAFPRTAQRQTPNADETAFVECRQPPAVLGELGRRTRKMCQFAPRDHVQKEYAISVVVLGLPGENATHPVQPREVDPRRPCGIRIVSRREIAVAVGRGQVPNVC